MPAAGDAAAAAALGEAAGAASAGAGAACSAAAAAGAGAAAGGASAAAAGCAAGAGSAGACGSAGAVSDILESCRRAEAHDRRLCCGSSQACACCRLPDVFYDKPALDGGPSPGRRGPRCQPMHTRKKGGGQGRPLPPPCAPRFSLCCSHTVGGPPVSSSCLVCALPSCCRLCCSSCAASAPPPPDLRIARCRASCLLTCGASGARGRARGCTCMLLLGNEDVECRPSPTSAPPRAPGSED